MTIEHRKFGVARVKPKKPRVDDVQTQDESGGQPQPPPAPPPPPEVPGG